MRVQRRRADKPAYAKFHDRAGEPPGVLVGARVPGEGARRRREPEETAGPQDDGQQPGPDGALDAFLPGEVEPDEEGGLPRDDGPPHRDEHAHLLLELLPVHARGVDDIPHTRPQRRAHRHEQAGQLRQVEGHDR